MVNKRSWHQIKDPVKKRPPVSVSSSSSKPAQQVENKPPSYPNPFDVVWTPTIGTAFKLLMSARLCAALWSVVSDCDETYNYWEPAHYLYTGKGFQTWEYSPAYALRSYAYIQLHVVPMRILAALLGDNSILVFYMMRCLLGLACALTEIIFYRGVYTAFGPNIARQTLVIMLFASGMFSASAAFLPSSFSMYLTMAAYGSWWMGMDYVAILSIAASSILGWPFAAVLGVPIAVDILFIRQKFYYFIKCCFMALLIFLVPMIAIDQQYYGKLVVAPLNIVLYNVFSEHGPDIYGTEPLTFYLINGFLNFNLAFPLALASLPIMFVIMLIVPKTSSKKFLIWLSLAPMYLWVLIFFTRPHKEERFLFPVYPFFALAAAMVLDGCQKVLHTLRNTGKGHYTDRGQFLVATFSIFFSVLSLSRIVAVHQGYHAPLDIYVELHRLAADPTSHDLPSHKSVNVCVGKEWHRFPSSFFLPGDNWHLRFLQSEFKGQLPKPYASGPDGTTLIPSHMNDLNKEEPERYVDISKCHYLVDRDTEHHSALEPKYLQSNNWTAIKQVPFLDASRSNRILRAFYVPFLSAEKCRFTSYSLLKSTRFKKSIKRGRKS